MSGWVHAGNLEHVDSSTIQGLGGFTMAGVGPSAADPFEMQITEP